MVAVLPVPQSELKKLAEANLALSSEAKELLAMIERVPDAELRNRMWASVSVMIGVGETIDRTVRAAAYTANNVNTGVA